MKQKGKRNAVAQVLISWARHVAASPRLHAEAVGSRGRPKSTRLAFVVAPGSRQTSMGRGLRAWRFNSRRTAGCMAGCWTLWFPGYPSALAAGFPSLCGSRPRELTVNGATWLTESKGRKLEIVAAILTRTKRGRHACRQLSVALREMKMSKSSWKPPHLKSTCALARSCDSICQSSRDLRRVAFSFTPQSETIPVGVELGDKCWTKSRIRYLPLGPLQVQDPGFAPQSTSPQTLTLARHHCRLG